MTKRAKRRIVLGIGLIAYGATVAYADPLLLLICVYCAFLGGLALCAAGALVALLFAVIAKRRLRPPLIVLKSVLGVALLMGLSLPVNGVIQERAVAVAKAYPVRVEPLLERYRRRNGRYPARLDRLPSPPDVPRLMRSPNFGYASDGRSYSLSFPQPGGFIDIWEYSSKDRRWRLLSM